MDVCLRPPTLRRSLLALTAALPIALAAPVARAEGRAAIETMSFFRTADERPTNGSMLSVGGRFAGATRAIEAVADVRVNGLLLERPVVAGEAYELYVATSPTLSRHHQLSLGRRLADWSEMDRTWQLGLFAPRFLLDPLRPEASGRTGLHYRFESAKWRVSALASPIAIPERGAAMVADDGRLVTRGFLWVPLPTRLEFQGRDLALRYDLAMPGVGDLLRPNAAVAVRYGAGTGAWGSLAYSLSPMHQADVAIDARIQLPVSDEVRASLLPRFPYQHLAAAEGGYRARRWNVWGSLTREVPVPESLPSEWMRNGLGPSLIGSAGAAVRPLANLELSASYLRVDERAVAGNTEDLDLALPSRFAYTQALRVSGDYARNDRHSYALSWVQDLDAEASLLTADFRLRTRGNWMFGLGADWILSDSRTGWFGQYAGNERIRWSVAYAF